MTDDPDRFSRNDEVTHERDHRVVAGELVVLLHRGQQQQRVVLVDRRLLHRLVDGIPADRVEVAIERFDIPGPQRYQLRLCPRLSHRRTGGFQFDLPDAVWGEQCDFEALQSFSHLRLRSTSGVTADFPFMQASPLPRSISCSCQSTCTKRCSPRCDSTRRVLIGLPRSTTRRPPDRAGPRSRQIAAPSRSHLPATSLVVSSSQNTRAFLPSDTAVDTSGRAESTKRVVSVVSPNYPWGRDF
jgi:hypothetical protein